MTPDTGGAVPRIRIALEVKSLDRGGLETVVAELARGLPRHGLEPVVICTRSGGALADRLRSEGTHVEVLSSPDASDEIASIFARYAVRLLNAHYSAAGTPVAAAAGIPVVVTLHNAYAWEGSGIGDEIRSLDPKVALYVAVSEFVAAFSRVRFAIEPGRIVVVRNSARPLGVDRSPENRAAARQRLGLPADAELVLHMARIERLKCQLATVAAVKQLSPGRPRLHTWIVGSVGEADYAEQLAAAITHSALADHLVLSGQRDDVTDLLAAADVVALPSAVEGLSIAALEALEAGVPVVLTRTGDAEFLLGVGHPGTSALPPAGALIAGPWPEAALATALPWQELRERAAAVAPPHAPALAAALLAILDDLGTYTARAAARAAALQSLFSPERLCRDYAELLLRVATDAATTRADAADARALDVGTELEQERAAAHALLNALRTGQETTLHEIARLSDASLEVRDLLQRILDKLRLGHRFDAAARKLAARLRRSPFAGKD